MSRNQKIALAFVLCLIPAIYWGLILLTQDVCGQAHCVTVGEIHDSLNHQAPMAVGFDIDETVLFASPVFYHVAEKQCEGQVVECMTKESFWEDANQLDSFSLPKRKGVALVKMHLARGDTVYFITARTASSTENLTHTLRKLFNNNDLPPVIFTGYSHTENLKIRPLKERQIKIFYGDSDADMEAALAAGARPIRVLRADNTLEHLNKPHIGAFNEEVVKDSGV